LSGPRCGSRPGPRSGPRLSGRASGPRFRAIPPQAPAEPGCAAAAQRPAPSAGHCPARAEGRPTLEAPLRPALGLAFAPRSWPGSKPWRGGGGRWMITGAASAG
jgi:hypothetical protein